MSANGSSHAASGPLPTGAGPTPLPSGAGHTPTPAAGQAPLLAVEDLRVDFHQGGRTVRAVDGLTYSVARARTVAVIGESGSGKTVSSRAIIGLLPDTARVTGSIRFEDRELTALGERQMRGVRGRDIAMVFQDPSRSLNPTMRIGVQITEAIHLHGTTSRSEAVDRAIELMELVRLPAARQRFRQYPHQLSGGMRQRVMIAAALVLRPKLLLADEPTTALDVTTQASILTLVKNLRRELGMSVLWISHDLGVIADVADRVAVMYAGELIEQAETARIFGEAAHPYTRGLIASSKTSGHGEAFGFVPGNVPEPVHWPVGCRFQPRCERSIPECATHPALRVIGAAHECRCVNPYGSQS
jgi:oligopeptide/dipeptide ABC transporter ATP-binding protein